MMGEHAQNSNIPLDGSRYLQPDQLYYGVISATFLQNDNKFFFSLSHSFKQLFFFFETTASQFYCFVNNGFEFLSLHILNISAMQSYFKQNFDFLKKDPIQKAINMSQEDIAILKQELLSIKDSLEKIEDVNVKRSPESPFDVAKDITSNELLTICTKFLTSQAFSKNVLLNGVVWSDRKQNKKNYKHGVMSGFGAAVGTMAWRSVFYFVWERLFFQKTCQGHENAPK
ncbi:hypothetical protein RFI_30564 [Reticulomyxa filosa]|uniref:Uncharacterized protein n=1 Tax=Reticulomyxa filosa TaxID=46433 RepID=X6LYY2_RETFI|nr:hypothetical protein RFI_30564 [Reticulomyxa filosa]|eukprot:ETO06829.1 hypothetical protein RFI_30564 [Reticulomyxa filosa]